MFIEMLAILLFATCLASTLFAQKEVIDADRAGFAFDLKMDYSCRQAVAPEACKKSAQRTT